MNGINFEWDEAKNLIIKKKHKISFEEAKTVFYDSEALVIDDPEHSIEEERFIILGLSNESEAGNRNRRSDMDKKKIEKLYELLEQVEAKHDEDAAAALRWAILKLENQ